MSEARANGFRLLRFGCLFAYAPLVAMFIDDALMRSVFPFKKPVLVDVLGFDGFVWLLFENSSKTTIHWMWGGWYSQVLCALFGLLLLGCQLLFCIGHTTNDIDLMQRTRYLPISVIVTLHGLAFFALICGLTGAWDPLLVDLDRIAVHPGGYSPRPNYGVILLVVLSFFLIAYCVSRVCVPASQNVREMLHACRQSIYLSILWLFSGLFLTIAGLPRGLWFMQTVESIIFFSAAAAVPSLGAVIWLSRDVPSMIARIDRGRCPSCNYDLRGSIAGGGVTCPECGLAIPQNVEAGPLQ